MFALIEANREDATGGQERAGTQSGTSPAANRGDWRATSLHAFTMPDFSKNAQQIRMGARPMAVPRTWRGGDRAGPAFASAAAASQVAVSGPAVADHSAAHHFEAKTGASACRIFFFNRNTPDEMRPGRLMVKAAKIMPAMRSTK